MKHHIGTEDGTIRTLVGIIFMMLFLTGIRKGENGRAILSISAILLKMSATGFFSVVFHFKGIIENSNKRIQ